MDSALHNIQSDLLFFFVVVVKPSCHDARKERTAKDIGCMNNSRSEQEKKYASFNWRRSSFLEEKKSILPGLEPGTDGFQAYRRDHCSISIWMNVGCSPKVLYFPITNLPDGVLLKARPQNRFLLLENIIVNQRYQHDRIPRLAYRSLKFRI